MQRTLDGVGSAERERGPHTALLHLCAAPLASQRPLQRPRALGPPSLPNYNLRATLNAAQDVSIETKRGTERIFVTFIIT